MEKQQNEEQHVMPWALHETNKDNENSGKKTQKSKPENPNSKYNKYEFAY